MEVQFKILITCDVSEIEGHGVEEEIRLAKNDLQELSLSGCLRYIQGYRVDSVEEIKREED